MSSSVKRVNPTDVQAYGTAAQGYFDNIYTALTTLCSDVVGVHYYGTNAYQFKYDAGELAEAFARGMAKDLGSLADGIRADDEQHRRCPRRRADQHHGQRQGDQRPDPAGRHRHPGGRPDRADRPDHHRRHPLHRDQRRDDRPQDPAENTDWKGDAKDGTVGARRRTGRPTPRPRPRMRRPSWSTSSTSRSKRSTLPTPFRRRPDVSTSLSSTMTGAPRLRSSPHRRLPPGSSSVLVRCDDVAGAGSMPKTPKTAESAAGYWPATPESARQITAAPCSSPTGAEY